MLGWKKVIGVVAVFCLILASTHWALRRKHFLPRFQRVIGVSTVPIWVQFNRGGIWVEFNRGEIWVQFNRD